MSYDIFSSTVGRRDSITLTFEIHCFRKRALCLLSLVMLCLPFIGSGSTAHALSIQQETAMGQAFMHQIQGHFELVDDDFAHRYINALGQYLTRGLETKPFPFCFYTIKHNSLNAFAGPGGHICIFSGLVEAVDSLDELVAVVSHEIGHVSARHISRRFEKSKKMGMATIASVLTGVIVGGGAGFGMVAGSMAASQQAQLHFSRIDERQADQISYTLMEPTGFDPGAMIGALTKIRQSSWFGTDKVPTYLLTHPAGPERMSNLEAMLTHYKQPPKDKEAARFAAYFPYFQTIIRARCHNSRQTEEAFMGEVEKDPKSFLPHYGLGLIYKQRSDFDKAIYHFDKAVDRREDFPPLLTSLGRLYQMRGEDEEAIPLYEKALEIEHSNKETLFLLGLSYRHMEQYEKAAAIFEKLAALAPVKNKVFHELGVSYGRQDKLALAHYNFGIYFMRIREPEKSKFHFEKAEELAVEDPALRKKIEKAKESLPSRGT